MKIADQNFTLVDMFRNSIAVADSWVKNPNKTGQGNGEAKLYISNRDVMREFYGTKGFEAHCFITKKDLLSYMSVMQSEYYSPSQNYRKKEQMRDLWNERINKINQMPELIEFSIRDQIQIEGVRGYVNSTDSAYDLIREIALPYVSYISVMKLEENNRKVFYWKLFADFAEIERRKNYVLKYGKKDDEPSDLPQPAKREEKKEYEYRSAREGQGKYREALLQECPMCPITHITEEALLIASHIKPWAVSNDEEKIDPKNGLILSPLYDKLFDRGFITFTPDRRVKISDWLSPYDKRHINLEENKQIPALPLDERRIMYLEYHKDFVFKG